MQEGRSLLGSCVRTGGIPLDISTVHPIGKSFIMRERKRKREREEPWYAFVLCRAGNREQTTQAASLALSYASQQCFDHFTRSQQTLP